MHVVGRGGIGLRRQATLGRGECSSALRDWHEIRYFPDFFDPRARLQLWSVLRSWADSVRL